ncbi:MAG: alpha/beta fold hydrolase, partial [Bryobacteraceae bacterium]
TKPANLTAGEKYPAVVLVYGGPGEQGVRNAWEGAGWAQVLAARGYAVWEMDNRGSSGRGHAFETPLYRRFGKAELADQLEGVRYLLAQGFADPARLGIYGWSYGGFMTLYSLLNAPDVFRAGIAGAPVTNWRNYDTIYTERYLGLPSENAEGYRASSPVEYAAKLKAKLLMLHNIEDDNVLFQNTLQMADALEQAGKIFHMVVYPQKSHGVGGPADRQLLEEMTDFFEKNLK